ncbi:hypothetical protein ACLOJK_015854 [Asimina triloba]
MNPRPTERQQLLVIFHVGSSRRLCPSVVVGECVEEALQQLESVSLFRLRWLNYLRPNIKHGEFTDEEDRIICSLFATIGSRWSIIAAQLPGRTDNDIKNYWNTKLKKRLLGTLPSQRKPQQPQPQNQQQQFFYPSPLQTPTAHQKTPTGLAGMPNIPSDLFNAASCMLQAQEAFSIHHNPPHSYHIKDSAAAAAFVFGREQSCSSSSMGSCSQMSYTKDGNGEQYGACEQMLYDNYFYSGLDEDQKIFLGGEKGNGVNGIWGEAQLEYCYDQEISANPCSNGGLFFNDSSPAAAVVSATVGGNKVQGRAMYN